MKQQTKAFKFFLIVALICTLAAVWLVVVRIRVEEPQKQIALVTSVDDLALLENISGLPEETWLSALKEGGLYAVMVPVADLHNDAVTQPIRDAGLEIAQVGGEAEGGIYFFATKYDTFVKPRLRSSVTRTRETLDQDTVLSSIENTGSSLVMVENIMQTGNFIARGFRLINFNGNMAKCFWLNKAFACKYAALDYAGSEELVNMMFRAIVDRGMTIIWISPISDAHGHFVQDPGEYVKMLQLLRDRISPAGYSYGAPGVVPTFRMSPKLLAVCGIGIMAAGMLLLSLLYQPKRKWLYWVLFALLALECIAAPFVAIEKQMQILALLSAMIFPAIAVVFLARQLQNAPVGKHAGIVRFVSTLLFCLLIVLWGCLFISATQNTSLYLLVLRMFRGVKISQLGVYAFSAVIMVWMLLHQKGRSIPDDLRALFPKNHRRILMQTVTAIVVVILAGVVYILRTGDGMLSVPELELQVRSFLESALIYRPRTKEFLVAFPAIAAAFAFAARGNRVWTAMFGLLGSIGFASVANTFCHMRAHFMVSLYRTLLGAAIGLALGVLVTLIARLIPIRSEASGDSASA